QTYTVTITDSEAIESTVLPSTTVADSYSFEMIQLESVTADLTVDGNGNYTYHVKDAGVLDENDPMYFDRDWTWTGTYTEEDGSYKLAVPTKCTKVYKCSDQFASYSDSFGEPGTFTEADDDTLLEKFSPCTATVEGDTVTYVID
ncbi:MAG: hypothetical protein K6B41_09310, partial [Butyrivibrio sp.]|nr:hypothetical protein [Butyrivibrio sp.]